MELIFYSRDTNGSGSVLLKQIGALLSSERLVVCRNVEELSSALLRPGFSLFAALLMISCRQDLLEILSLRDSLCSVPVILVLPGSDESIVSAGHALRPRFISWPGGRSDEILAVLQKMLGRAEQIETEYTGGNGAYAGQNGNSGQRRRGS